MLYIKNMTGQNMLEKSDTLKPPKIGEIVKGKIINKGNASVFLDLSPWGTGIIYGREFYESKDKLKDLKIGDIAFVKVIDLKNEDGYIEVSLNKAGEEIAYETLKEKKEKEETITVKIIGANKGGLLAKVFNIPAFLPVSQLSPKNYPKVKDGDAQEILKALQKFIGKEMEVKIFDFDPEQEKLILSEKATEPKEIKKIPETCKVGNIVEAEITAVVDFGAFVKFNISENTNSDQEKVTLEGLIHISELDWQLIEDPSEIVKVGEKVKAKIIDISDGKISLSLKALKKDPWENIEEKYKKGDIIEGKVTKLNPFGAFIQVEPKIQGLCHISEFGSAQKMEKSIKLNEKYNFKITLINQKEHRMTLKPAF